MTWHEPPYHDITLPFKSCIGIPPYGAFKNQPGLRIPGRKPERCFDWEFCWGRSSENGIGKRATKIRTATNTWTLQPNKLSFWTKQQLNYDFNVFCLYAIYFWTSWLRLKDAVKENSPFGGHQVPPNNVTFHFATTKTSSCWCLLKKNQANPAGCTLTKTSWWLFTLGQLDMKFHKVPNVPYHPWGWYIHLHLVVCNGKINVIHASKYQFEPPLRHDFVGGEKNARQNWWLKVHPFWKTIEINHFCR